MAKILVVDDEEQIRSLLKDLLERDRHEVYIAEDGAYGLEKVADTEVDLIITDLVMPNKTGIDFIMELKKSCPNVKVIAISGGGGIQGRFDYLEIAKLIGAEKTIRKPFTLSQIREAVAELMAA